MSFGISVSGFSRLSSVGSSVWFCSECSEYSSDGAALWDSNVFVFSQSVFPASGEFCCSGIVFSALSSVKIDEGTTL